ncbi:MAG: citrate lyase subunit alpha [Oscillospiraceae bacterium]|nr:citrate lyase subunit alpha [Oscillospiraceae bacterium]WMJ83705.1 citrate lyase subunit alpha [Oscillospiraceae bacterium MB24-C1]
MLTNAVNRNIPEKINNKKLIPYQGEFALSPADAPVASYRKLKKRTPDMGNKIQRDLTAAIRSVGLKDGMTISFHHGFRDGDLTVLPVLEAIRALGIKNLTLAPSSLTDVHDPVVEFIKDGTITHLESSGLRGKLGKAVSEGILENPVVLRTHGDRVRAIQAGELNIDVAFLAVASADEYGNATGCTGKNICGALGYAMVDAKYAANVVLITDNLVSYPCSPISIDQSDVDCVVVVDQIGDSALIGKGAARTTRDPKQLLIAENTTKVIEYSGLFVEGFSVQTGVGAVPIAVTNFLGERMRTQNIHAAFALGGIGAAITRLHQEGYIQKILAVQSFDTEASAALCNDVTHIETETGTYANIFGNGCCINKLDICILSALEMDTHFNCNILTGSNGELRGALGGGPDCAGAARLSIMAMPLIRGRIPSIVDEVNTICTPGTSVDCVVTEYGVAVNTARNPDLTERLRKSGLKLFTMQQLKEMAERLTGKPEPIQYNRDKIVAVVEYRDGSIIDVVYQVLPE